MIVKLLAWVFVAIWTGTIVYYGRQPIIMEGCHFTQYYETAQKVGWVLCWQRSELK